MWGEIVRQRQPATVWSHLYEESKKQSYRKRDHTCGYYWVGAGGSEEMWSQGENCPLQDK